MSVTFTVRGDDHFRDGFMNVCNGNAKDLLAWLDIAAEDPNDLFGSIKGTELAAKCRRRLWDIPRNHDAEIPMVTDPIVPKLAAVNGEPVERMGARVVYFGRDADYLRGKTEILLKIAEAAGDRFIDWG